MPSENNLHIGLEDVAIAETSICRVDGEKGELTYRGYWVEDLARKHSYEEVVYLLWYGKLPATDELKKFCDLLISKRMISDGLKKIIQDLPKELTPMATLRTVISSMHPAGADWPPTPDQAVEILAKAPSILAYRHALLANLPVRDPKPELSHAANYLYMLHGEMPKESHVQALQTYWILSSDHDMNASTFTARVITSTRSDIVSAIVGAIGALIGPLHGGTPSKVDDMLDLIRTEENAEPWIRSQLEKGERLMGFGHRVYKTYDPRAAALRNVTEKFAHENHLFKLSLYVEKVAIKLLRELKPDHPLYPNLEFWAAGVLRTLELPRDLYTPTFCCGRIAGWSAQIFEQAANNRLIRPLSHYVGKIPTTPPPKHELFKE